MNLRKSATMPSFSEDSPGIIAITMAGEGSRFKLAGSKLPKYQIKVKNKTLFEWSMMSLGSFIDSNWKFVFIAREEHNPVNFIKQYCKKLNIKAEDIILLSKNTDGQASTAKIVADKYPSDIISFAIFNIDTYVSKNFLNYKDIPIKKDGWIPCFNGSGDMWSFVKTDENHIAIEVREKKRISNNASIGFYWFKSTNQYAHYYNKYYDSNEVEKHEKYIAPIFNSLIKDNKEILVSLLPLENIHILGTPEQVDNFDRCYIK